jgi:hypothetical protein
LKDRGLVVIVLLGGSPQEQVMDWVDQYNLTFPVIGDEAYVGSAWEADGAIPSKSLVAPGGEIIIKDAEVEKAAIEELLPW